MSTGIYKITNLINGKMYIGQSVNIERRWRDERAAVNASYDHEYYSPKCRAMRKYGLENFSFEILEECASSELNQREKYWADTLHTYTPDGYNVAICGHNSSWHWNKLTPESFQQLVVDLQTSTMSEVELAKKYSVSLDTVSTINLGKRCVMDYLDYPLRKSPLNKKAKNKCPICGRVKDSHADVCRHCYKKQQLADLPREILDCIYYQSMCAAARKLGISDKGLCHRLEHRGIPSRRKEYRQWYEENILNKE